MRGLWLPLVLLAGIAALTLAVRVLEPYLAFFPSAGETETPRNFGMDYAPLTIRTADGEQLHAWQLTAAHPRARIIYFHGNGGNLSVWAPIVTRLAHEGYSVLAFDYRGYGRSTGRPTERGLYRDVEAVVGQTWTSEDRSSPLVYWGRSLGATMAAYAATVRKPDGIVLESGFPDARSVVRTSPVLLCVSVFSSYRFPTTEFLARDSSPLLIMHGDRDRVIPYSLGQALFDRARNPKKFLTIVGADHNDAAPPDERAYWRTVEQFTSSLRSTTM